MSHKTILLIEDNPDDVRLTLRALRSNHISNRVVVMNDGVGALDYLLEASAPLAENEAVLPTVTFLDLKLPKMAGFEVLKAIRGNDRLKRLPVVILTSSREERDILRSYDLGANSYVSKPVNFEQFVEVIGQLGLYWLILNEAPVL